MYHICGILYHICGSKLPHMWYTIPHTWYTIPQTWIPWKSLYFLLYQSSYVNWARSCKSLCDSLLLRSESTKQFLKKSLFGLNSSKSTVDLIFKHKGRQLIIHISFILNSSIIVSRGSKVGFNPNGVGGRWLCLHKIPVFCTY